MVDRTNSDSARKFELDTVDHLSKFCFNFIGRMTICINENEGSLNWGACVGKLQGA